MTPYATLKLSRKFVQDYIERDLPSPDEDGELEVVKWTQRYLTVRVNKEAFNDILNDAYFYSDPTGMDPDIWRVVGPSARSVVRQMEAYLKDS